MASNYRITAEDQLSNGGAKTKAKSNLAAIQLLKELEIKQRPATPEEQSILVKYSGWGPAPDIFTAKPDWANLNGQLREILTDSEYEAARGSTINAHYTEPTVVAEIYKGLEQLGFPGGRILDPSMGATGLFEGGMPEYMASSSDITGIELDAISGLIATQLYPESTIHVRGFQDVILPDDYFDLSISNVPFSEIGISDPRYKGLPVNTLHDYFFAKGLDKVRPGGLVTYITSTGTMQSAKGEAFRKYLGDHANLVGAMRLPGDAFKQMAGTEVTTDLIILQKLGNGVEPNGIAWTTLEPTSVLDVEGKPLKTNQYYAQRPELMLGTLADDKLYPGRLALKGNGQDLATAMRQAFTQMPTGIYQPALQLDIETSRILVPPELQSLVKQNGYTLYKEQLMIRQGDFLKPVELEGKRLERVKGLLQVKEAVQTVFDVQLNKGSDQALESAQTELGKTYDNFVRQHGYISQRGNSLVFSDDPDYPLLLALERYDRETKTATKTDIFFKRTIQAYEPKTHADNAKEGLLFSLNEKGRVDIPYIAQLTSTSKLQVVIELQNEGLIFRDPEDEQWQTQDEYLSGNVKQKLAIAKNAARRDSQFDGNVQALISVQPEPIPPGDIEVRLGATWVPSSDVEQFTCELLGVTEGVIVRHSSSANAWYLEAQRKVEGLAANNEIYGTEDRSATQLIETALNLKNPAIYMTDPNDSDRRILDKEATAAARLKLEEIKERFKNWIWEKPDRTERLTTLYNEKFNTNRERQYDGSHLELPGKDPNFILRPHQANAVYRSLSGNTLLGHAVGAGKTATMIAAAMEQRRLGFANKPMIVVPNHMLEQFAGDFKQLYPTANILAATKADSSKGQRQELMSRIATGQWDAVIVTHTAFEKLKLSDQAQSKFLKQEFEQVREAILSAKDEKGEESRRLMKDLEKKKSSLKERIEEIANSPTKDNVITFEQLGIDLLVVDESHYFKNLGYVTKMRSIAGLPNTNSKRAFDMLMKVRHMAEVRGEGKGVIFATGTPIANSMAELYTIQRYLQPDELERMGLASFDDWASVFGETVTSAELSVTGAFQIKTRFAEFVNMAELMGSARQVIDIQTADMLKLPVPALVGGQPTVVAVPATDSQLAYMEALVERAANMRDVDPTVDNMLKITSNGRAASTDMRLLYPNHPDDPDSKTNRLVADTFDFWEKTQGEKTHLIFSDLGTPKKGGEFSLYQDIKDKLIAKGIPEKEIAFAQSYKTDAKKLELQQYFNSGKITVLITGQQLETGFNGQRKLARISHYTVPWRPDQVEQRDGRMLRQGNENAEVETIRYVTQGRNGQPGIDGYFWQTLETKARFIAQAMNGSSGQRRMADISESALNYAEIKAIATGNPLIMEKATVDNTISQLSAQKRAYTNSQYNKRQRLNSLPHEIDATAHLIQLLSKDLETAKEALAEGTVTLWNQTLPLNDVEEIGKRIRSKAALLNKAETSTTEEIGKLGGLTLSIESDDQGFSKGTTLRIAGESSYRYEDIIRSHRGAHAPLPDVLTQAIPKRLEAREADLTRQKKDLADLSATSDQPFPKEPELLAALKRQAEIHTALDLNGSSGQEASENSPLNNQSMPSGTAKPRIATEADQGNGITKRVAKFLENLKLESEVISSDGFYLVLTEDVTKKSLTIDSDGKQLTLTTEFKRGDNPNLNIEMTLDIDEKGILTLANTQTDGNPSLDDRTAAAQFALHLSVNKYNTGQAARPLGHNTIKPETATQTEADKPAERSVVTKSPQSVTAEDNEGSTLKNTQTKVDSLQPEKKQKVAEASEDVVFVRKQTSQLEEYLAKLLVKYEVSRQAISPEGISLELKDQTRQAITRITSEGAEAGEIQLTVNSETALTGNGIVRVTAQFSISDSQIIQLKEIDSEHNPKRDAKNLEALLGVYLVVGKFEKTETPTNTKQTAQGTRTESKQQSTVLEESTTIESDDPVEEKDSEPETVAFTIKSLYSGKEDTVTVPLDPSQNKDTVTASVESPPASEADNTVIYKSDAISVSRNLEQKGIEVRFSEKPEKEWTTQLKAQKFRFSKKDGDPRWYRKESTASIPAIDNLAKRYDAAMAKVQEAVAVPQDNLDKEAPNPDASAKESIEQNVSTEAEENAIRPSFKRHLKWQEEHPDAIVLIRSPIGFFEIYGESATIAAKELGTKLSSISSGSQQHGRVPINRVFQDALDTSIAKLRNVASVAVVRTESDVKVYQQVVQEQALDDGGEKHSETTQAAGDTVKAQAIKAPREHSRRAEKNIAKLIHGAGISGAIMQQEDFVLKIQNEPHKRLTIEAHPIDNENRELYIVQYTEVDREKVLDREMVFNVSPDGELRLSETAVPDVFNGGTSRIRNGGDRTFAGIFAKNLIRQGFAKAAIQQQGSQPSEKAENAGNQSVSPNNPLIEKSLNQRLENTNELNEKLNAVVAPSVTESVPPIQVSAQVDIASVDSSHGPKDDQIGQMAKILSQSAQTETIMGSQLFQQTIQHHDPQMELALTSTEPTVSTEYEKMRDWYVAIRSQQHRNEPEKAQLLDDIAAKGKIAKVEGSVQLTIAEAETMKADLTWLTENYPETNVVPTNAPQQTVALGDLRQWYRANEAINQGNYKLEIHKIATKLKASGKTGIELTDKDAQKMRDDIQTLGKKIEEKTIPSLGLIWDAAITAGKIRKEPDGKLIFSGQNYSIISADQALTLTHLKTGNSLSLKNSEVTHNTLTLNDADTLQSIATAQSIEKQTNQKQTIGIEH